MASGFDPRRARFFFDLERELSGCTRNSPAKTYRPGPYRTFTIYEGKTRQISAAPFRDRVVHHALTGVLEPIFERSFIFDSYACRKGKGTHAAVDRCQQFARRLPLRPQGRRPQVLPLDRPRHPQGRWSPARSRTRMSCGWSATIIDHSNPQDPVLMWFPGDDLFTPIERRRGLPLGNQTSQFFANVYLDPLDHFVTDRLGLSYVRYVDDFLVFADDKRRLHEVEGGDRAFPGDPAAPDPPGQERRLPVRTGHPVPGLPGLPDAPAACQGERPPVPPPDALDAARSLPAAASGSTPSAPGS